MQRERDARGRGTLTLLRERLAVGREEKPPTRDRTTPVRAALAPLRIEAHRTDGQLVAMQG